MILKKLSELIIINDIRREANSTELYFLSHLMGHEMLILPDNWPARIYTSKFIFDVISRKKPEVQMNFFRILQPNVPVKFRSKDKTIMVTMFETGEITHNVMFHFEDGNTTHLYSGIFTQVCHLNFNKYFKRLLEKGLDYIYIDTTRCRGKSYLFAADTIEEISKIYTSNPNKPIAVIIPDFGYEAILVGLLSKLPQKVYPTTNQRNVLTKLGFGQLIGQPEESRIKIHPPGITVAYIQMRNLLTIYIAEGKPSTSACGIQTCQWSPYPSVMNLQQLLEMTRPRNIVPIKRVPLEEKVSLPPSFRFFLRKDEGLPHTNLPSALGDSSLESLVDGDSNKSYDSHNGPYDDNPSPAKDIASNQNTAAKQPIKTTVKFIEKTEQQSSTTAPQKTAAATSTNKERKENRKRQIRRPPPIEYDDSDED